VLGRFLGVAKVVLGTPVGVETGALVAHGLISGEE